MRLLLKCGRVIDPSRGHDTIADLLIEDGKIAGIGNDRRSLDLKPEEVYDASGKIVLPGLIDMHVHLREPGFEHKEDIESGSRAAAAGGFTGVATMPNTSPVTDNRPVVEFIRRRGEEVGLAHVYPIGALTKGHLNLEPSEIGDMTEGGAVAFSDDAFPIENSGLMRRVMEYCSMFDKPVLLHCEDKSLAGDGQMNEGLLSTTMGLAGIPAEAEEIAVARNLMLARLAGCRVHICHVSTKGSVEIIRRAKQDGISVTCETCPQYFTLTEDSVRDYNTYAKINPPLRTPDDVEAIKAGLADGTIDVIATDHAPHAREEKEAEFAVAPNGMVGLETAVGLVMTELVKTGVLSVSAAFQKMTINPARILGLTAGTLQLGAPADVTVIDPAAEWVVDPSRFYSKMKESPLRDRKLTGRSVMTILGGHITSKNGEVMV